MSLEGVRPSLDPDNEDPDRAETGGTGPGITDTMADGVPAITGTWDLGRVAEPAEEAGSSWEEGPKRDEDEGSSSP